MFTQRFRHKVRLAALVFVVVAAACSIAPTGVFAADNQASGDIAGNAANLGNSNLFTINTSQLSLVKAAFLTDGTPIASGTTVAKGTPVKFLIYMDNTTAVPVDSVNVQDVLAAQFVYQPGTIRVSNTVNTGAAVAAIYAGTTISAGASTGNGLVTVPASKVWAMLFTVKVQ